MARMSGPGSALEVLGVATRLGLTSFGGPIAHLGYFHEEYVVRRRWIDEARYADLVALCQFLPGPASSQVGIAVGILRAGLPGGVAAWLGFTLPSAFALVLFAYALRTIGVGDAGWLHGLKVVAVAVVAQAVWTMARNLTPDRTRASLAILASLVVLASRTPISQVLVIVVAGLIGWMFLRTTQPVTPATPSATHVARGKGLALMSLGLFFALLVGLPIARQVAPSHPLAVFDSFYRTGSLVFGGGHVVLPLLQSEVVTPGWVTNEEFIAGYGAAQAVPGPLFTFAAYLGAVMHQPPDGWMGAAWALIAIFLPSFFLVTGALPFWESLRGRSSSQAALSGINCAVVGLLLAAFFDPVWTSAITSRADFGLALVAFAMLVFWRVPPWLVVVIAAIGGALIAKVV
jgi:chromate transporter